MEQEKLMMKQKIEIMEQEINEKEQQLQGNNIKISNLKKSKNLLIKGLNKNEKINELKTKENDELKNDIEKLKELNKMFTEKPIILQDVKKRENKARTFAPPDDISKFKNPLGSVDNERKKLKLFFDKKVPKDFDIDKLLKKRDNKARTFAPPHKGGTKKIISDFEELQELQDKLKIPKNFDIDENKYININLSNVNNLIDEMKKK